MYLFFVYLIDSLMLLFPPICFSLIACWLFVDNFLLAKDARAIRKYYSEISPDIRMEFYVEDRKEEVEIPIGIGFFWPDAAV